MKGRIKIHISGIIKAFVVALLVLMQFAIIILAARFISDYALYFYFLLEILSFIVILTLVNSSLSNSYKIAWICVVLLLPISGHIMFWLWGKSDSKRKIEKKVLSKINHGNTFLEFKPEYIEKVNKEHPQSAKVVRYLEHEGFPVFKNNTVEYFNFGEKAFEQIFTDLENAKEFIFINFFIVAEGAIWDRMHEILLKKIKEGVEVKFMYDDFGAMLRTPKHFDRILTEEGFEVRIFNPIHKYLDKLYLNYRSHQKAIIIDGKIGYTGGINLADEYANILTRFGVWKDTAVRFQGEAVWGLTVTFLQMWEISSENKPLIDYNIYKRDTDISSNVYCQVVSDGPANHPHNPIESMYRQLISSAQDHVYITTPYMLLENAMIDALNEAAKAGVDVRIITPFIPDKKYVKILTNYNYGKLLQNGVRIYEYVPGFIHAKMIINDETAVVGTVNMDYRSFYLHYECGIMFTGEDSIKPVYDDFNDFLKDCHEVTYDEWKNRPISYKMIQPFLNLFSTLL